MSPETRAAVQAYYRLSQALDAIVAESNPRQHEADLTALAWEANAAMRSAGLLGIGFGELVDLVRVIHPNFRKDLP